MLEGLIIKHSSPTLAGLKPGSLFGCMCSKCPCFEGELEQVKNVLKKKGVTERQLDRIWGGNAERICAQVLDRKRS